MARLLAAQDITLLHHALQHVPVAYVGALHLQAVLFGKHMQAQVGHDRGHHRITGQLALALQIQTAGGHHLVAVNEHTVLVHGQAPVGVTVEGDADVVAARLYHGSQRIHVGRTAFIVDVDAVGVGIDNVGTQLGELVKEPGRSGIGGAVGAIHQDAQASQIAGDGGLEVVNVVGHRLLRHIAHLADLPVSLAGNIVVAKEDDILNLLLQLIGELKALAVEDLDAVVLKGIVAGGNDDTGIRPLVHRHPGHTGGGQSAQIQHVGTGGAQSSNQGALQQVPGDAGVLADGDHRLLPRLFVLGQNLSRSQSDLISQICIQAGVDYTANSVRTKQFTHISLPLSAKLVKILF